MTNSKNIGNKGEDLAALFLQKGGFNILYRNFYSKFGEIDIIAIKNKLLLFVEVKYRSNESRGKAEEMVSDYKKQRILRTAKYFLMKFPHYSEYNLRFDLIAISKNNGIKHIKNIILENI